MKALAMGVVVGMGGVGEGSGLGGGGEWAGWEKCGGGVRVGRGGVRVGWG